MAAYFTLWQGFSVSWRGLVEGGIGVALVSFFTVKVQCLGGGRNCWQRGNVWVEGFSLRQDLLLAKLALRRRLDLVYERGVVCCPDRSRFVVFQWRIGFVSVSR